MANESLIMKLGILRSQGNEDNVGEGNVGVKEKRFTHRELQRQQYRTPRWGNFRKKSERKLRWRNNGTMDRTC